MWPINYRYIIKIWDERYVFLDLPLSTFVN